VLRWPAQADLRSALVADDAPRLLVLDPDAPAPLGWDDLEDWIRPTAGPAEIAARTARLEGRGRGVITAPRTPLPLLDGDGTLRAADGRVTVLAPVDTRLVHLLLDRCDHVVRRPELKGAGWPGRAVTDRAVDARISRVRERLLGVGLQIATIRGVGYMLERVPSS
jgi:two-component system OmpR family response regulator